MRYKDVIRKFEYPSKTSTKIYTCIIQRDGTISCNCKGWCNHVYEEPIDENERPVSWSGSKYRSVYRRCKHTKDASQALKLIEDTSKEIGIELDI